MLQFKVKDQIFGSSLEAQEYADNLGTLLGVKKLAKDRGVSVDELLLAFGKTPTPTELGNYFSPPRLEVSGATPKTAKFLTLKPYQGKQLDLFQNSSITRAIQCQMEQVTLPEVPSFLEDLSTEDLFTYTLNPGNSNDAQDKRFKKVKVTDRMALEDYRDDLREINKVTVTTQPTKHSKAEYSLSPLFVPKFCKQLGLKLDVD